MKIAFDKDTNTLKIPNTPGVVYKIDGEPVSGDIVINKDTTVTAEPDKGYSFAEDAETSVTFTVEESDSEDLVEIIEVYPEDDK